MDVVVVLGVEVKFLQLFGDLVLVEAVVAPRNLVLVTQQVELARLRAAAAGLADVEDDESGLADAVQHEASEHSVIALAADHLPLDLRNGEAVELEVVVAVVEAIAVVEGVEGDGVVTGDVVGVHQAGLGERLHGLAERGDGAVGGIVGKSSVQLQHLPRGPDPVRHGVVQEEDGVVGRVAKRRHGVHLAPADQNVDVVMHDLELDFEVAEVRLLECKHHFVRQVGQLAEVGGFEKFGSTEIAARLVSIHHGVMQRVGHGLAGLGVLVVLLRQDAGQLRHGQRPVPIRQTVVEPVGVQRVL